MSFAIDLDSVKQFVGVEFPNDRNSNDIICKSWITTWKSKKKM